MTGRRLRRSGSGRRNLALAFVLAGILSGCSGSRTRFVPPEELPFVALNASREELLEELVAESGQVQTIRATVNYLASGELRGEGGELREREYDSVRGGLAVERPSLIRMNANTTLGLVQAFDMSSDGDEFRLSVPARGRFYYGPNEGRIDGAGENPLLQLRPHHVLQSLFVDIGPYMEDPDVVRSFAEATEGRRSFYVFSFIDASVPDARLLERIWIDRRNLEVGRKQLFAEDGALELEVEYDNYQVVEGVEFPHRVSIDRPVEGASLRIEFLQTELNEDLDAALFQIPFPQGAESIRVGDATPAGDGAAPSANGSRFRSTGSGGSTAN